MTRKLVLRARTEPRGMLRVEWLSLRRECGRLRLEQLALTPRDVAGWAGISESRLSVREQGGDPGGANADELASLASAGVDETFLLTGQWTLSQDESDLVDSYRDSTPEKRRGQQRLACG